MDSTDVHHLTSDTTEPTVIKIRHSGLFSAADGLFLASFLAVTIIVAYVVRVVCRRYCAACCPRKQDPYAGDPPAVAIQIEAPPADHQPGRHTPAYSSEDLPNYNEIVRQDRAQQQCYTISGKQRKAPGNPHGMQTLYEEDERMSGSNSSLSSLGSRSSAEKMLGANSNVYSVRDSRNIYSLPYSYSNDVLDSRVVAPVHRSVSLDSHHVSFSQGLDSEQPPSYEDLYPSDKKSKLTIT